MYLRKKRGIGYKSNVREKMGVNVQEAHISLSAGHLMCLYVAKTLSPIA